MPKYEIIIKHTIEAKDMREANDAAYDMVVNLHDNLDCVEVRKVEEK
jgi:hypothetical protein